MTNKYKIGDIVYDKYVEDKYSMDYKWKIIYYDDNDNRYLLKKLFKSNSRSEMWVSLKTLQSHGKLDKIYNTPVMRIIRGCSLNSDLS